MVGEKVGKRKKDMVKVVEEGWWASRVKDGREMERKSSENFFC